MYVPNLGEAGPERRLVLCLRGADGAVRTLTAQVAELRPELPGLDDFTARAVVSPV
ncbi:hypothetical protein ACFRMO_32815 [Streptomyces anulatus]|uniref:hypothetical protein n=1 Tax=Streptomyces anulatus TaxID=1892 RepID=UPI00369A2F68